MPGNLPGMVFPARVKAEFESKISGFKGQSTRKHLVNPR